MTNCEHSWIAKNCDIEDNDDGVSVRVYCEECNAVAVCSGVWEILE